MDAVHSSMYGALCNQLGEGEVFVSYNQHIHIPPNRQIISTYKHYSTKFTEFSQKVYVSAGIVKGKEEIDTYP
ncbi:hypothetical protein MOE74_01660 [Bacillus spizizenii]|nr:hypothetical protein [Bacillus spizizenii]